MTGMFTDLADALLALGNRPGLIIVMLFIITMVGIIVGVIKRPNIVSLLARRMKAPVDTVFRHLSEKIDRLEIDVSNTKELQENYKAQQSSLEAYLREREQRQNETQNLHLRQSSLGMIYSRDLPTWDRFMAALAYFRNDGNGNAREYIANIIIDSDLGELWASAVNEDVRRCGSCQGDTYNKSIQFIYKRMNEAKKK